MFQRILVPLDRSPLAEQAIPQAAALARAAGATIDIILVHAPVPFAGYRVRGSEVDDWARDHDYVESIAKELTSGAGLAATHSVLRGEPVEMICRRVEDSRADLIVMTSHGRTGLSRAWLGSVTDAVIRHAQAPVLMLRPMESAQSRRVAHHVFKQILVPLDSMTPAADVADSACTLAKCGEGRVTLLHVVPPVPVIVPDAGAAVLYPSTLVDDPATALLVDESTEKLDALAVELERRHHVPVDTRIVVDTSAATAILEFAHDHGSDVIAMPTHGHGASRLLLGSIADKVLRASALPMLMQRSVAAEAETAAVKGMEAATPVLTPA